MDQAPAELPTQGGIRIGEFACGLTPDPVLHRRLRAIDLELPETRLRSEALEQSALRRVAARTGETQHEVRASKFRHQTVESQRRVQHQDAALAGLLADLIPAHAEGQNIAIRSRPADENILAGTAIEHVVATKTAKGFVERAPLEHVIALGTVDWRQRERGDPLRVEFTAVPEDDPLQLHAVGVEHTRQEHAVVAPRHADLEIPRREAKQFHVGPRQASPQNEGVSPLGIHGVASVADVEHVRVLTLPAVEPVVSATADNEIVATTTFYTIVAGVAEQAVPPEAAGEPIGTGKSFEQVLTRRAGENHGVDERFPVELRGGEGFLVVEDDHEATPSGGAGSARWRRGIHRGRIGNEGDSRVTGASDSQWRWRGRGNRDVRLRTRFRRRTYTTGSDLEQRTVPIGHRDVHNTAALG